MFNPLKKREETVRGRPQSMCHASRQQRESGTAVAMNALDSTDATVVVSEVVRAMMSSSKDAMRFVTDMPAPYFVMYFTT